MDLSIEKGRQMSRHRWVMAGLIAIVCSSAASAQVAVGPLGGPGIVGVPIVGPISPLGSYGVPQGGGVPATIFANFSTGNYVNVISYPTFAAWMTSLGGTVTRNTTGDTDLLPSSASGFAYTTFGANVARISPGVGLIVEETRTNLLLNSTVPATQTTGSLANGTYTLWVNGSGSATMSAGTATGCGTDTATQGTPVNFTTTGTAGTCTVTVAGSLNAFQLELGPFGTSLIVTAGSTLARNEDVIVLASPPTIGAAYTLFGSGTPEPAVTAGYPVLSISNGAISNRFLLIRAFNTLIPSWIIAHTSATTVAIGAVAWAANTFGKVAASYSVGAQAGSFNGATATTDTSVLTPAGLNAIHIGDRGDGTLAFDGALASIAVWPTIALTASQLQAVSQ